MKQGNEFLSISDVASLLSLNRQSIWLAVKNKAIPAVRFGRKWLLRREDVENLLTRDEKGAAIPKAQEIGENSV